MSNLECKHRLYKKVGLIGKAFSHEVRLELIELLSQCPQTVEKLSEMLDEDYKSISAHLRVLYRAGLVTCTRNGRFQRYGLASPKVTALAVMIRETAEQSIAELPCLEAESGIPNASLGIEDAVHYASEGKLILLDVRPAEEFAAGHLPHAINMPIEMLGKRMPRAAPRHGARRLLPRSLLLPRARGRSHSRGFGPTPAGDPLGRHGVVEQGRRTRVRQPRGIPEKAAATRHQNAGLSPTDP